MATDLQEYRELHKAADALEAKLERQFLRAVKHAQDGVEIDTLALVLSKTKKADNVMKLIPTLEVGNMVDTALKGFSRGARLGEKQVNALD
tara:strand:+ start:602 stop:874 length:273 start_codon:yes stop_codon:yes gene_type:complete